MLAFLILRSQDNGRADAPVPSRPESAEPVELQQTREAKERSRAIAESEPLEIAEGYVTLGGLLGERYLEFEARCAEMGRQISPDQVVAEWSTVVADLLEEGGLDDNLECIRIAQYEGQIGMDVDEDPTDEWLLKTAGLRDVDPLSVDPRRLEEARSRAREFNDEIRAQVDALVDTLSYQVYAKLRSDRVQRNPLFSDGSEPFWDGDEVSTSGRGESPLHSLTGFWRGQWGFGVNVYKSDDPRIEEAQRGIGQARGARRLALKSILGS